MKSKAVLQHLILSVALGALLWTSGCVLISRPTPREIILVKPGDPVWLTQDVPDIPVLTRGEDGQMRLGTSTLKAGCTVWYDQQWNDKTLKPVTDGK